MKAKELMIGDWGNIYVFPNENPKDKDLFPAKITAVLTPTASESSGDTIECMFTALDGTGGVGGVGYASRPPETFLPIPLTTDILQKNGFVQKKGFMQNGNFGDGPLMLWHTEENKILRHFIHELEVSDLSSDKGFRIRFECNYVHQLQHALRLCGIDDEILL